MKFRPRGRLDFILFQKQIINMINENAFLKSEIIDITEDKSLSNNDVIERINLMLVS